MDGLADLVLTRYTWYRYRCIVPGTAIQLEYLVYRYARQSSFVELVLSLATTILRLTEYSYSVAVPVRTDRVLLSSRQSTVTLFYILLAFFVNLPLLQR